MRVNECVRCKEFPCADVKQECYIVPDIDVKLEDIAAALRLVK